MTLRNTFSLLLLVFALLLPTASRAAIDTDAEKLLQQTADFIYKADGMYVAVDVDVRQKADNTDRTFSQLQIAARRPNLYARQVRSQGVLRDSLSSDGKNLVHYVQDLAAWDEKPAPQSLDPIIAADDFAKTTIVATMLTSRGYSVLTENITAAKLGEDRENDGTPCHVIAFEEKDGTGEMLIAAGAEPLLRQYNFESDKVKVAITFSHWDVRSDIAEQLFIFSPVEEARKVPSIDALNASRPGGKTEFPAYKLIGQPAPDISLSLLSGEPFRLSKVKEKNAIVLEFWNTRDPRSFLMLPSMAELTDSMQDRGVALFTVNLKEDEEIVRNYMSKMRRQFLVAMDSSGATVDDYKIGSVPMVFIIDKENIIRFVHVGAMPKELIQNELISLVGNAPVETPTKNKKKKE